MSRVVVLRPEPGASETIERARARGLDPISIPLFAIEALDWDLPELASFDALLLTSANALRFAGEGLSALRGLPVHAVGRATADAARQAGFDIASQGDAGAERLLSSLEGGLKLLHVCGEDRAPREAVRQTITTLPVYRSKAIDPGPDIGAAKDGVVLIHSPRAGHRFGELADQQALDRKSISLAAISEAAARAAGKSWMRLEWIVEPKDDALLALAQRLCDKQPQE